MKNPDQPRPRGQTQNRDTHDGRASARATDTTQGTQTPANQPPAAGSQVPTVATVPDWMAGDDGPEPEQIRTRYPRIGWRMGLPALRESPTALGYAGGFFLAADQEVVPTGPSWAAYTAQLKEGETLDGWISADLGISILASRRCWVVIEGDRAIRYAGEEYDLIRDERPRGVSEILARVEGLSSPCVIQVKGIASGSLTGPGGILASVHARLTAPADRIRANVARTNKHPAPRPLHPCRWLVRVGVVRDQDGHPSFSTVGQPGKQQQITRPGLLNPDRPQQTVPEIQVYSVVEAARRLGHADPLSVLMEHEADALAAAEWRAGWSVETLQAARGQSATTNTPTYREDGDPGYDPDRD